MANSDRINDAKRSFNKDDFQKNNQMDKDPNNDAAESNLPVDHIQDDIIDDDLSLPTSGQIQATPLSIGQHKSDYSQDHQDHEDIDISPEQLMPFVDINLTKICENFDYYNNVLAPNAMIAPVVKCDGYGLGADPIAQALVEREGCRAFFVANAYEGRDLRIGFLNSFPIELASAIKIYILNGPAVGTLPLFEKYHLTPVLNTKQQIHNWIGGYPEQEAILQIDTGMNRLGLPLSHLGAIKDLPGLNVSVIMSHLACAGSHDIEENAHLNAKQRSQFLSAAVEFPQAKLSLSSSGGAMIHESYHYSMIRLGVSLYGIGAAGNHPPGLSQVARLCAPILQIREIRKGESVGYDATWRASRTSKIATIAIGYGDGYPRCLSNKGSAIVQDRTCPIIGRISMDLITLDITDAGYDIAEGDIVELFGPNLPIVDVAKTADTIGYELLTALGPRIIRRYRD